MKKIEYQTRRARSCFHRKIELNEKKLILKRFITKNWFFFCNSGGKTDPSCGEWGISSKMKKITYHTLHVRSCFNRVIELNQKKLIFTMISYKKIFLVIFGEKWPFKRQMLLEAGASLSTVDKQVNKPSVKLRQSNIKPFKWLMRNVI